MLSPETIQNLNEELSAVEEEIKVLNKRKKGIASILGIKLSERRAAPQEPVQDEQVVAQEKPTPETPQTESREIVKVPLNYDFIYLNHETNDWVKVQDKNSFVPGIVFQALKANRVIPFRARKVFTVVKVEADQLLATPYSV